jgi:membrane-associated phospholipid phosphatase
MKKGTIFLIIIAMFLLSPRAYAADTFEKYGDIGQIALPVIALVMTAVYKDREGVVQFARVFGATMGVTYGLKYVINAKRPYGGDHSFPSGHTASAFAGAGFIQQRYGWNYGLPAYAAATLVGISRVTSGKHYAQDVAAAAAIAIGANLIFTKKIEKRTIMITPVNLNKGVGVIVTYNW